MKISLILPLLLCSIISFSQKQDKELHNLLDSIKAIDPYARLYSTINEQSLQIERQSDQIQQLSKNQSKLRDFFYRQYVYRKVFDKLELGMTPDSLDLEKYREEHPNMHNFNRPWTPCEIPKFDDNSPIIIFIDPESYTQMATSSTFKSDIFTDICLSFKEGDATLEKRYPKVFAMIQNGELIFQNPDLYVILTSAMQIPKLQFPSQLFTNTNNSLASRQTLAANLLSYISDMVAPRLQFYDSTKDIVPAYLQIEKEKFKRGTVDQKIDLRIKFIEYLRKKYQSLWR